METYVWKNNWKILLNYSALKNSIFRVINILPTPDIAIFQGGVIKRRVVYAFTP